MAGYLQRLVSGLPDAGAALEPVVRSHSPVADHDQRLSIGSLADSIGEGFGESSAPVAMDEAGLALPVPPTPPLQPPAMPATAAVPATPAPVSVQRFVAPVSPSTAPAVPPQQAAPQSVAAPPASPIIAAPASTRSAPQSQPLQPAGPAITIINEIVRATSPPAEAHEATSRMETPQAASPALRPGHDDGTRPAPLPAERRAEMPLPVEDALPYATPIERAFAALTREPVRQAAPGHEAVIGAPITRPAEPVPPRSSDARTLPGREVRETIREIVREMAPAAPAPREVQRVPRTAEEASVIGPLGDPLARARRAALMLR